jgi:hypothetical protein
MMAAIRAAIKPKPKVRRFRILSRRIMELSCLKALMRWNLDFSFPGSAKYHWNSQLARQVTPTKILLGKSSFLD